MKIIKTYLLLAVFFASHLLAFGELTKDELKQFKRSLEIGGVRDSTWKDDDRNKYEVLEVYTLQNQDDPSQYDMSRFRIRLIVEVTDSEKKTYLVKFTGKAPEDYEANYRGEDYWDLHIPHGDLGRLKISGYSIEYGLMDGETFVPLAQEEDDSEEMLEREKQGESELFEGKVFLWHYCIFEDSSRGDQQSTKVKIKRVKE